MRLVAPFYPVRYHRLNGGLFEGWISDPQHHIRPDRFIGPHDSTLAVSHGLEKVLILNRVSLLTFPPNQIAFPSASGAYGRDVCQELATDQNATSYLCPKVGPIGYFPRAVLVLDSSDSVLDALKAANPRELLDKVWIEVPSSAPVPAYPAEGKVHGFRRGDDSLVYNLEVTRPGFFVVTDTYFPGWKASWNSKRVDIFVANIAFKAVYLEPGRSSLELVFDPR
jgi:hypothetical protein